MPELLAELSRLSENEARHQNTHAGLTGYGSALEDADLLQLGAIEEDPRRGAIVGAHPGGLNDAAIPPQPVQPARTPVTPEIASALETYQRMSVVALQRCKEAGLRGDRSAFDLAKADAQALKAEAASIAQGRPLSEVVAATAVRRKLQVCGHPIAPTRLVVHVLCCGVVALPPCPAFPFMAEPRG